MHIDNGLLAAWSATVSSQGTFIALTQLGLVLGLVALAMRIIASTVTTTIAFALGMIWLAFKPVIVWIIYTLGALLTPLYLIVVLLFVVARWWIGRPRAQLRIS
jgi:hypothetical protein